jgi:hypothetical protein
LHEFSQVLNFRSYTIKIRIKKKSECLINKIKRKKLSSEEDDEEVERVERDLTRIHKLYPHWTRENIRPIFFQADFNVKKTIEILVKRDMEESDEEPAKSKNESLSIDEWSDGDENIRAKNKAANDKKKTRVSDESSNSSTATAASAASSSNAAQKRKTEDKIGRLLKAGIFISV